MYHMNIQVQIHTYLQKFRHAHCHRFRYIHTYILSYKHIISNHITSNSLILPQHYIALHFIELHAHACLQYSTCSVDYITLRTYIQHVLPGFSTLQTHAPFIYTRRPTYKHYKLHTYLHSCTYIRYVTCLLAKLHDILYTTYKQSNRLTYVTCKYGTHTYTHICTFIHTIHTYNRPVLHSGSKSFVLCELGVDSQPSCPQTMTVKSLHTQLSV